jgi:alkanesulfonate monooxygenase SsuD/methylene tetrahydromethanopterin reductase-like flavin-dependent oxidoreductase (luciferase family)
LLNPILAAKQMVTADHVGEGRFGLNVVVGWNEDEFEMFGVTQRDHEARYAYGTEWLDALKAIWSEAEDFDIDGAFLTHRNVRGKPKPYGGSRPMIMNAGGSPTGRAFALKNCDAFFTVQHVRETPEQIAQGVAAVKSEARGYGRDIDVYTVGVITCRPTTREARDYHHHAIVEHADWGAVDAILAKRGVTRASAGAEEFQRRRLHQANGMGGLPIIGDPDVVAEQLADLSRGGLRGIGVSFVNYLDELPYFAAEVLPRLVRLGVRAGAR